MSQTAACSAFLGQKVIALPTYAEGTLPVHALHGREQVAQRTFECIRVNRSLEECLLNVLDPTLA